MNLSAGTPGSRLRHTITDANHMGRLLVIFLVVTSISVLSCSDDDPTAGPCIHNYRDAVVHLASVRDHATQAPLDTVFISAATVDGHPHLLSLLTQGDNANGITLVGDSLQCVPPCSFGQDEGHWAVTLSARGFARQAVEFDADYAIFHGGCPSWNDNGTVVNLELGE